LRDAAGQPLGMIGFFEARNHAESVSAILHHAAAWLRERGCGQVVGPIDGDTWHHYRLNLGPRDLPPFLMEPYNPPWYAEQWEAAGATPLAEYCSKAVTGAAVQAAAEHFRRHHDRCVDLGYTFRPLDLRRLPDELGLLHQLSLAIFADNLLYTPLGEEEFRALYTGAGALLDPQLVQFAYAPDGAPAGFVFSFLDYARAMAAMRGRRHLLAKFHFVVRRHLARALNVKTLGVTPRHRRTGLAGALIYLAYAAALERGLGQVNLCLMLDANVSTRLDHDQGSVLRRYRLYELP
jgi:GNAT superfamily N-acetyltransferase